MRLPVLSKPPRRKNFGLASRGRYMCIPHEGYNMLYAQDMGDESYGGGYNCEDDLGQYYSSLPCENTPCVTNCPSCDATLACDALDDHICPADNLCILR